MLDFLHSLFETILQAVLAVVLGVFGFAWEAPTEEEDENTITALLLVPEISILHTVPTSAALDPTTQNCASTTAHTITPVQLEAIFEPI